MSLNLLIGFKKKEMERKKGDWIKTTVYVNGFGDRVFYCGVNMVKKGRILKRRPEFKCIYRVGGIREEGILYGKSFEEVMEEMDKIREKYGFKKGEDDVWRMEFCYDWMKARRRDIFGGIVFFDN